MFEKFIQIKSHLSLTYGGVFYLIKYYTERTEIITFIQAKGLKLEQGSFLSPCELLKFKIPEGTDCPEFEYY